MKKIILSTLTAASFIAASESNARNFTGFSVGANLGATFSKTKYGYDQDTLDPVSFEGNGNVFQGNGLAGLVFGYGHLYSNCLYLGAEVFVDGNFGGKSTLARNQGLILTAKKTSVSYGALARFGGTISPDTLMYVGIGGKSNKLKYDAITAEDPSSIASISKRSLRLLAEAGLEGYFTSTKNLTWRAAYQYIPGKTLKITRFPDNHQIYDAAGNAFASIKTHDHTLRVGIAYHF